MQIVFYHGHCADGYTAFWVWARSGTFADDPHRVGFPIVYHEEAATVTERCAGMHLGPGGIASEIVFLDYCPRPDTVRGILARAPNTQILVIDHHASQVRYHELLRELGVTVRYNNNNNNNSHSGAMLAWLYCNPSLGASQAPWLVKYAEDRDLWNHELPMTKEINTVISTWSKDLGAWTKLASLLEGDVERRETAQLGEAFLKYKQAQVEKICEGAWFTTVASNRVPVVNTTFAASDVGHRLCELFPAARFSVTFRVTDVCVEVSLRSSAIGADVKSIALGFGGGGHRSAAGYTIERHLEPFPACPET